jgi:hypothetical protein
MIHRSVASRAANALIVSRVELYPDGCTAAAHVQPPMSTTGADVADTNA